MKMILKFCAFVGFWVLYGGAWSFVAFWCGKLGNYLDKKKEDDSKCG